MNTVKAESEVDVRCYPIYKVADTNPRQFSLPGEQVSNAPEATPGTDETGYTYDEAMAISIAEGHLDPTSSDMSSSSSQSSSNNAIQGPTVVSRHEDVPVARTDHYVKFRLQLLVQDIELIRSGSQIDYAEEIPDHLYVKMWQSLLSVCENVQRLILPMKWADKVDPRFFPRLKVTVIRPDDEYA
jgi:hypothetical protein